LAEWPVVRLGDLISVHHGWPFRGALFSDELTGRPIVVNIGNFRYTGGFRFDETTMKEYRGGYPPQYELRPGQILLVMTCQTAGGEILGIPAKVPDDGRTYLHNQRLGLVAVKPEAPLDRDFLYWLFLSPDFNRHLVTTASGSKILHTSPGRIEGYRFRLPSLPEQRARAEALGALDDKVELNRRMNETLEAIARAIFKSWFIDFDPVHAKSEGRRPAGVDSETAALFPGHFEGSSVGAIPASWEFDSLVDITSVRSGGTPKTSIPEFWDGEVLWFSVVDVPPQGDVFVINTERKITQAGVENSAAKVLPVGTTIMTARGTVGKLALTAVPMAMNQSCYGLVNRRFGKYFTYYSIREAVDQLRQRSHGSVFATITKDTLKGIQVLSPSQRLTQAFEDTVHPFLSRIVANLTESRVLAQTRDLMLPRVLAGTSGQK